MTDNTPDRAPDKAPVSMAQDTFEARAQTVLRESAERLDGRTRSRLTQARYAALEAAKSPRVSTWKWAMPAVGATAAAVVAVVVLTVNPARQPTTQLAAIDSVDTLEIITAEDSLEFYRDMDFYAWVDTVLDEEEHRGSDSGV